MCSGLEELGDRELIARFKATGDNRYFAHLFERYQRPVYEYCFKLVGNQAMAEDLCQEGFVRALEKIASFNEQDGNCNFSAWLWTICKNANRDGLRRLQVKGKYDADSEASGLLYKGVRSSGGIINVAGREYNPQEIAVILRQVGEELLKLSAERRMCWLLRHVQGYSYEEIAENTGLSLKRVETNIQAVARHLRSKFR